MFDVPFRGSVAVGRGLVTAGRLRGPRFVRLFPDVYVSAAVDVTLRIRALAAHVLVDPCVGVVAGYAAAELLGASCGPIGAPPEVVVRGHIRPHPGLLVHRGRVLGADRATAAGCRVTSARRTAWDLARRLDLDEAVVAVDALAFRGHFDPAELLARRAAEPGTPGCRRLDAVVSCADRRAESPMETRMRLALHHAGLPAPQVQHRLVDRGEVVARFDLAYPEARLAIEYDGEEHEDDLDRRRDIRTGRLGWYTARFTKHEIRRPAVLADAVRDLLRHRLSTERDTTIAGA